jgi:dTDP-4-dehydrorhamnose reductase
MARQKHRPKLLLTGASGILGWTLCRLATKSWEVFGTVFRHPVELSGVHMHRIDLTDERSVVDLFSAIRPDTVVHAAALSSPDYCQDHPDESEAINVTASTHIASLCSEFEIPCVFTSSDLIFDGEHAPYDEDSQANPISTYGEHKLRAETAMRARYPNTTICRLPLMFGEGSPAADGSFKRMLQAMEKGQELRLFVDEIRTPVSTSTAAQGLILALQKLQATTLHLGGPERINRWELGCVAAEVFQIDNARLVPGHQKEVAMSAPRPRDVSLVSSQAEKIGYRPQSILEQMHHLRAMMKGAKHA